MPFYMYVFISRNSSLYYQIIIFSVINHTVPQIRWVPVEIWLNHFIYFPFFFSTSKCFFLLILFIKLIRKMYYLCFPGEHLEGLNNTKKRMIIFYYSSLYFSSECVNERTKDIKITERMNQCRSSGFLLYTLVFLSTSFCA